MDADDRGGEPGGDNPESAGGDDFGFQYGASVTPEGVLSWAVWGTVEGQDIRAEAPTALQAWDRAISLAMKARAASREANRDSP